MPIPTEYRDIVKTLDTKTTEGNVNWRKDKYDISVTVDKSKFSLWAGNDEHTDEPFVALGLYDANGSVVDSWFVDQSDRDYTEMYHLHKSASRHALGVPGRLKELEGLISQMKIVGTPDDV
ncbi:MAG TPA: hypothetical protein VGD30_17255 [Telluria sp.]